MTGSLRCACKQIPNNDVVGFVRIRMRCVSGRQSVNCGGRPARFASTFRDCLANLMQIPQTPPSHQSPHDYPSRGPEYGTFPGQSSMPPQYGRYYPPPYQLFFRPKIVSYAGFWRRLLATLVVDPLVATFVTLVAIFISTFILPLLLLFLAPFGYSNPRPLWWIALVLLGTPSAYYVLGAAKGGTPGFRMLGMEITASDGGTAGMRRALIRQWNILYIAGTLSIALLCADSPDGGVWDSAVGSAAIMSGFVLAIVWVVGCLMQINHHYRQALHDRMAGTYVLHKQ